MIGNHDRSYRPPARIERRPVSEPLRDKPACRLVQRSAPARMRYFALRRMAVGQDEILDRDGAFHASCRRIAGIVTIANTTSDLPGRRAIPAAAAARSASAASPAIADASASRSGSGLGRASLRGVAAHACPGCGDDRRWRDRRQDERFRRNDFRRFGNDIGRRRCPLALTALPGFRNGLRFDWRRRRRRRYNEGFQALADFPGQVDTEPGDQCIAKRALYKNSDDGRTDTVTGVCSIMVHIGNLV